MNHPHKLHCTTDYALSPSPPASETRLPSMSPLPISSGEGVRHQREEEEDDFFAYVFTDSSAMWLAVASWFCVQARDVILCGVKTTFLTYFVFPLGMTDAGHSPPVGPGGLRAPRPAQLPHPHQQPERLHLRPDGLLLRLRVQRAHPEGGGGAATWAAVRNGDTAGDESCCTLVAHVCLLPMKKQRTTAISARFWIILNPNN